MNVTYATRRLERLAHESSYRMGLPREVVTKFHMRLALIQSAPDENDLRELRGLSFKKLKNSPRGQYQIHLNKQYRVIFNIHTTNPRTVEITFVGDPH